MSELSKTGVLWGVLFCLFSLGCQPALEIQPRDQRTQEIGVLFRKQFCRDPHRPRILRHVDVLLADGSIVGFRGGKERPKPVYMFFGYPGNVRRHDWLKATEPWEVDVGEAQNCVYKKRHRPYVSLWVHVAVTPAQAEQLATAWAEMEKTRPRFQWFSRNCVTRAAETLAAARIIPGTTPGIEMPSNLLRELKRLYGDALEIEEGYFGYRNGQPVIVPLECPSR